VLVSCKLDDNMNFELPVLPVSLVVMSQGALLLLLGSNSSAVCCFVIADSKHCINCYSDACTACLTMLYNIAALKRC
jgi:hypothetical protein